MTAVGAAMLVASLASPAHAQTPQRIASFNLCADQLVVALADPSQIVGLSPYASDPRISAVAEQARKFPKLPLQAEALVPHRPDLVLVGTWDRPLTQRLLRSLGFRVVGVDVVANLDAARAQIRDVAKLLGHPERGEALIARIDAAQRRLAAAPRPASSSAMLIGNNGYTVGPDSLASALMTEAGLTPPRGAPKGYGGYRAAGTADRAEARLSGDGEPYRAAGRAGRALSHASGAARDVSGAKGASSCRAASRCARGRA